MTPAQIARTLTKAQRDFILKMKPHCRQQIMNAADWAAVDPYVEDETDAMIFFGGMRGTWEGPTNRAVRRFQFAPLGLSVRAAILASEGEG